MDNIIFVYGSYYIARAKTGYSVYKNTSTHATKVGNYGHGEKFLEQAKHDVIADRWTKVA